MQEHNAKELAALELIEIVDEGWDIAVMASDNIGVYGYSNLGEFKHRFPDRCIDAGIAEGNETGIAVGLALTGKIVFAFYFGPFLSLRATEQTHTDVAYNDVPVRLISTHGGLSSGGGPRHNAILDFAIMRAIPNMTVVVPADANQCVKIVRESLTSPGPMLIRLARAGVPDVYDTTEYEFAIGKANVMRSGGDITLIGTGIGVFHALEAAAALEHVGIHASVIDMHTLKPFDAETVIREAERSRGILTIEDHSIIGGLGSAVAELIAEHGIHSRFKRIGVPDRFAPFGAARDLYSHFGISADGIVENVKALLEGNPR